MASVDAEGLRFAHNTAMGYVGHRFKTDVGMLHQFQPLEVWVADKFSGMHETDSNGMLMSNIDEVTRWDSQSPVIATCWSHTPFALPKAVCSKQRGLGRT